LKSFAETRVTLTELAGAAGLSEGAVRYRVRRRQLTPPDGDGLFNRERALAELRRKPKQRGGRQRGGTRRAKPATAGYRLASERYRLARAEQEELKLERLRESVIDASLFRRQVKAIFRAFSERVEAWLSQLGPMVAAEFGGDERRIAQAMEGPARELLAELRAIDVDRALAMDSDASADSPGARAPLADRR
jgi:hypothetical protein